MFVYIDFSGGDRGGGQVSGVGKGEGGFIYVCVKKKYSERLGMTG